MTDLILQIGDRSRASNQCKYIESFPLVVTEHLTEARHCGRRLTYVIDILFTTTLVEQVLLLASFGIWGSWALDRDNYLRSWVTSGRSRMGSRLIWFPSKCSSHLALGWPIAYTTMENVSQVHIQNINGPKVGAKDYMRLHHGDTREVLRSLYQGRLHSFTHSFAHLSNTSSVFVMANRTKWVIYIYTTGRGQWCHAGELRMLWRCGWGPWICLGEVGEASPKKIAKESSERTSEGK